jgi:hypothetical protein
MLTTKSSLLRAILASKIAIPITTLLSADLDLDPYLDIEVEGDIENGKPKTRSHYIVQLSVANKVVVESTCPKPRSSVLKWEWTANNEMWVLVLQCVRPLGRYSPLGISEFEPLSTIKVELYRRFKFNVKLIKKAFVVKYEGQVKDLLDNGGHNVRYVYVFILQKVWIDASFILTDSKGNPVPAKMKIALSPVSTSTATSMPSGNIVPQDNDRQAIGGLPAVVVDPETRVQQANVVGSAIYEGFKTVVEGLYNCSDMFLPLKTAAGGILTVIKLVEVCVLVYNNTHP